MSDIMDTVGFGRYQLGLGLLLGTLWMADGSELLCLSLCTQSLSADGILPTDKTLASHATGALGSCIFVGFLIGSLLAGPIADTYGRRRPILAFMGLLLLAGGVAPASMSYAMLVVTRTVLGVAIGGAGPAAFTLFAEFCPSKQRGVATAMFGMTFTFGEVLIALVAYVTPAMVGRWRVLMGISVIPAVISFVAGIWLLPESPMYEMESPATRRAAVAKLRRVAEMNGTATGEGSELDAKLSAYMAQHYPGFALGGGDGGVDGDGDGDGDGKGAPLKAGEAGAGGKKGAGGEGEGSEEGPKRGCCSELVGELFRGEGRTRMTLLLWVIWFVQSFVFYGTFVGEKRDEETKRRKGGKRGRGRGERCTRRARCAGEGGREGGGVSGGRHIHTPPSTHNI
jgi:MFS family permease